MARLEIITDIRATSDRCFYDFSKSSEAIRPTRKANVGSQQDNSAPLQAA